VEVEKVCLKESKKLPADYVGKSAYAKKYAGELIRPDGTHYSTVERRAYYNPKELRAHPAKTPPHIARWAVQEFTNPGDWVLDPTAGVGTTLVEALIQNRNAMGIEIEFAALARTNIKPYVGKYSGEVISGDARDVAQYIKGKTFGLVVNNPPYSGDVRQDPKSSVSQGTRGIPDARYDTKKKNLALLGENEEYWRTLENIYVACIANLKPGRHFVIGVKDMMRKREPYKLHEKIGDILSKHLTYKMMVVMKHWPPTLHLNTYEKLHGVKPPLYQTILVFQK
jgi:DNA modification methylase